MHLHEELLENISKNLIQRKETVSIAESVTSGMVQLAFSEMPNAEKFFEGGLTAYTIDQKVKHLNIDYSAAKAVNCVSRVITENMAVNIAELFETDWSIATTGYATPTEESSGEVYAYYAVTYHGKIIHSNRIDVQDKMQGFEAQQYFTMNILSVINEELNITDLTD